MKLTAATVDKMQPTDRRQEIPDTLCTGLYLTVQPTGKKGWQVRYRHDGVHRRMSLGGYPVLSLADARQRARDALAAATEGRDPAEEVKAAKAPKTEDDRDKSEVLICQYHKRHLSGLKSGAVVRRELDRHVVAAWGDREIHTISKRDVIDRWTASQKRARGDDKPGSGLSEQVYELVRRTRHFANESGHRRQVNVEGDQPRPRADR